MQSILITGGAGFIGSHIARRLIDDEQAVVVIDNYYDNYAPSIKRENVSDLIDHPLATVVEGDIRDAALIQALIRDHNVGRIAHLAGMGNVRSSIQQAPLYVEVNINGTVNVLEAARHNGVELVVCASTSSVYGHTTQLPFVETDAADRPLASYPATKRASELLAHTYTNLFGLNVTNLRFFNVYGPRGRPDMMPLRVLDAIVNQQEITLFNGGKMQRDWTYIDDIVDGVVSALNRPLGYEIINLGYGSPFYMTEFIDIMEELTGERAITTDVPAPKSEPLITYCDNSKARDLLDFTPQTSLPAGLAHTWEWFRTTQLAGQ